MSTPTPNPADLFGLIGGLLGQGQAGSNPLDLGQVFGGLLGDAQEPNTPAPKSTPSAGRVASDVFTAACSVGEFLKANLPKRSAGTPVKEELTELLMDMLVEHDGLENITAGKRESLYRATASKWADKILKQEKSTTKVTPEDSTAIAVPSTSEPKVTRVPVVSAEEVPVEPTPAVAPQEDISKNTSTEKTINEKTLDVVGSVIHNQTHPDHPEWDICKEQNLACKYSTLGSAMVALQGQTPSA